MIRFDIATPLDRIRLAKGASSELVVDRTGGKFGAGIIRGVSLCTAGEALGHGRWLDEEFIESVTLGAGKYNKGLKIRFTHPSLSADGLGRYMGRAFDAKTRGTQSIGDIHLAKVAHNTPDGDLASYVMDLAEEDPEAFALSIVFEPDYGAESRFRSDHMDESGKFTTPDKRNQKNLPHARLSKLWAADFVDDPAANPSGLFHRHHQVADEADKLFSFALGLSTERPQLQHLNADPDRIAAFAQRFLTSHGLELRSAEMSKETTPNTPPAQPSELEAALSKFGEGLLAKVDAKLASFGQPIVAELKTTEEGPKQLSAEQIQQGERDRCKQLQALGLSSGLTDGEQLAKDWIDKGTTVLGAKAHLGELAIERNKLSSDSGDQPTDVDAKAKAEYRKYQASLSQMGVTEEEYVSTYRVQEGREILAPKT